MKLPFSLFLEGTPTRILRLICLLTIFISCQQKIGIDEEPRCLTEAATDLTMTTATINGKVVGLPQGKSISEACFYFSSDISSVDSLVNMGEWLLIAGTNLSFSYTLQNLMPNQRYYYVAAVIVAGEELFGEVNSFTTTDLLVETGKSEELTIFSVELFGRTVGIPSSWKDVKYGFETGSNKTNLYFHEGEVLGNGIFTGSIYLPNTDSCYYRACVQYNGISYYGETKGLRVPEFNVKIETKDAVQVQHVTAIVNGLLPSDNPSDYDLCFYYTQYESDIKNGKISNAPRVYARNSSSFSAGITGLIPGKKYYYQAFVRRGAREAYGDIKNFTTKDYSYTSCEPVDLGLSVKWSSTNVGAPSPEYYGIPVAWGEIKTKSQFRETNYKWCNGTMQSLKKYNSSPEYGPVDNKLQLELEDDVAYVLVGTNWRIPTYEEAVELCDNCVWEWGVLNGIEGCYIKSKVNGNSIFLPATGVYDSVNSQEPMGGNEGYYWTSSVTPQVYMKSSNTATSIYFWRTRIGRVEVNSKRSRGEFVRPVMIES